MVFSKHQTGEVAEPVREVASQAVPDTQPVLLRADVRSGHRPVDPQGAFLCRWWSSRQPGQVRLSGPKSTQDRIVDPQVLTAGVSMPSPPCVMSDPAGRTRVETGSPRRSIPSGVRRSDYV